jgi:hypothetical protein
VTAVKAVPVTVAAAEWTGTGDVLVRAHVRPGAGRGRVTTERLARVYRHLSALVGTA